MKASFDYSGCNVFVVGGTSGINLGIAEAFAQAGARVGVASRRQEKVDAAVSRLGSAAGPALGYAFDVRDAPAVADGLSKFAQEVGSIDVLVSGAAGNFPAPFQKISANGFKSVVDIDLLGTFNVMKAAYPHLRRPEGGRLGGSAINISAPQALVPMAWQVHVCAAKAGVDMVTRSLAIEWGAKGLRINSLIPGPIAGTEGMARLAPDEAAVAKLVKGVPLGRMGTPRDVANACLFLGSEAAAYVTGTVMTADGGWAQIGAPLDFEAM